MQESSVISISPSFNRRVVEDEFYFEKEEITMTRRSEEEGDSEYAEREMQNSDEDAQGDTEFEFAIATRDSDLPFPISADEILHNGQIRPVYPVFDRDLFMQCMEYRTENGDRKADLNEVPTIRLPLRKLFDEDRESAMTMTTASSCSSSDMDELDGIPEDSYCVWRPKEAASEGRCKRSSSAGSISKRWRFKDLLNRSQSNRRKNDFVTLSPSRKKQNENRGKEAAPPVYGRDDGEKQQSNLPYKQDLLWFLGNVNGLSKKLQPF